MESLFYVTFWPTPDSDTLKGCEDEEISCLGEFFLDIEIYSMKIQWQDFKFKMSQTKSSILY